MGTPLFIRDIVTRSVLPRFFEITSVTLSVTLSVTHRDKMGLSVTFPTLG